MKKRKLGSQGLEVAEIGLGCMGMSEFYSGRDDAESEATIHRALDQGVTLLDTADMYGPHINEELVRRALRSWQGGKREDIKIATKFGIVRETTSDSTASPFAQTRSVNGRPEYVKQSCDGSLKRLGVDTIDLYYQHRLDPNTPIEETVGAMADLVKAGKVRYIGLSEAGSETIRKANKVHPITALQSEYSLWTRDPEDGVLQTCRELGIGFVAYSPLGRGFLTGRFKSVNDFPAGDYRQHSPRFQGENFEKNLDLVAKIESLAKEKGATASQLALAWVLAQGKDIVPIPGTKRRKYLDENLDAANIQLSAQELREIDAIAPMGVAAGMRYPEHMMAKVDK
jgi:aryl-alcohol dehydrogenase-like predicted oxidoreductase